jgi:L-ascorbate metabolism protein UlaG (beta-lactamase superfamily)
VSRFGDRATQPERGPGALLRWKVVERIRGRGADTRAFDTPTATADVALLVSGRPAMCWIGHATFVLRLGGQLIATDPVFSKRLGGTIGRRAAPGLALDDVPPLDVVTVSHNHFDHMDLPTLRRLAARRKETVFVTPLGNARWLAKAGAQQIVELDWWQETTVGGLTITCTPARHWSMRAPWNRNDALWSGFLYRGSEGTAYHSGDTAYFNGFAEIGKRTPIDWAMLPIGAYEPRWFMEPQHMNPEDAGQAFIDLGARHFVAMHWGTFQLTDEFIGEPPERIRAFFAERGLGDRLWVMHVGETRAL